MYDASFYFFVPGCTQLICCLKHFINMYFFVLQLEDQSAVLNLTYSGISRKRDLLQVRSLERLIFEQFDKLNEIDGFICNLKRLKHLNLKWCYSLRGLPEKIDSLSWTEAIGVSTWCQNQSVI